MNYVWKVKTAVGATGSGSKSPSKMNISQFLKYSAVFILAMLADIHVVAAHDYWLEPQITEDGATNVRLFVGECLTADEEKHYEPSRTTRLETWQGDHHTDLRTTAHDGALPLLNLPAEPSQRLLVFERNASYIELAPEKFDGYLHDEGLEAVRVERRKRGESDAPGRERYLRFLKTLIPGHPDAAASHTVGQMIELVPQENPAKLKSGQRLHVRLLFKGEVLPEAKIDLCIRDLEGKVSTQTATSDRQGQVVFTLPGPGIALLRTVHMHRVTDGDPKADWESLWTSYSFIVS